MVPFPFTKPYWALEKSPVRYTSLHSISMISRSNILALVSIKLIGLKLLRSVTGFWFPLYNNTSFSIFHLTGKIAFLQQVLNNYKSPCGSFLAKILRIRSPCHPVPEPTLAVAMFKTNRNLSKKLFLIHIYF